MTSDYMLIHVHVGTAERTCYGWMPVVLRPHNKAYPQATFSRKTKQTYEEALRYATMVAYRRQMTATHRRPHLERAA